MCLVVVKEVGTRERKRTETQQRIAAAAARLAGERGITETTVEEIAAAAGIGRATFFRYFDSKELAIATGLSDVGVHVLSDVLAQLPPELGPLEAVRAAHAVLGENFEQQRAMFLEQAQLSRSSKALFAWTLHLYVDWETAIAEAVAPRFSDLAGHPRQCAGGECGREHHDPRPQMVGALSMAAARLACDVWVADGGRGDLPELIQDHLTAVHLTPGAS